MVDETRAPRAFARVGADAGRTAGACRPNGEVVVGDGNPRLRACVDRRPDARVRLDRPDLGDRLGTVAPSVAIAINVAVGANSFRGSDHLWRPEAALLLLNNPVKAHHVRRAATTMARASRCAPAVTPGSRRPSGRNAIRIAARATGRRRSRSEAGARPASSLRASPRSAPSCARRASATSNPTVRKRSLPAWRQQTACLPFRWR